MERFLLTTGKVPAYALVCAIIGWLLFATLIGTGLADIFGNLTLLVVVSTAVLAAPFVGAWIIWRIVRRVNRRDDPRFAKLPPNS